MKTANGFTHAITVMSGDLIEMSRAVMPIGRRIVTVIGVGFRLTVGLGLMTKIGVGRHIITDVGFITTVIGFGRLTDCIANDEVGGDLHWSS